MSADPLPPGWRLDPDTGERLRPGVMTRAESAAYWAGLRARVRTWSFGPCPGPEFHFDGRLGWVRRSGTVPSDGSAQPSSPEAPAARSGRGASGRRGRGR
jgi:hypothetical protein